MRKKCEKHCGCSDKSLSLPKKEKGRYIAVEGLAYTPVPEDGHCLYNAVALYLELNVITLRQMVAAKLESNKEAYKQFIVLPSGKTIDDYIEDIRSTNEWAGDVEISILITLLGRPIVSIGPEGGIVNRQVLEQSSGEPIFVYYDEINHYDGAVLQPGYNAQGVLTTLIRGERVHDERKECTDSDDDSCQEEEKVVEIGQPSEKTQSLIFKVEGMCCATEVELLKSVLSPLLRERRDATTTFDVISEKLIIESKHDDLPSIDEITKVIATTGMNATLWSTHIKQAEKKTFWQRYGHITMNIVGAVSLVGGFIFHAVKDGIVAALGYSSGADSSNSIGSSSSSTNVGNEDNLWSYYPPIPTMVFYSTSIVAGAWFILPKAIRTLRRLRLDTNVLTLIATGTAVGINQWFEATSAMYLYSVAELLETWNMNRARKAIRALLELAPSTADVVSDIGVISEQLVEQVPVGATITVKPGGKIPMDSVLTLGSTFVNQAPVTGESLPVQKEEGDVLFAGTINGDSAIQCRVTKAASDSTLASIIKKVEEAQSRRARSDQWIEKFSNYYIPSVFGASIIVSIVPPLVTKGPWYPWIYKGLELLMISCPCSLVISTPISIVAGLTKAARSGVLIKGGVYLEAAASIKAVAMDKTGTITTGEPIVQNVIPLNGYDEETLLKLATALESHSDHPLARAIQRKARTAGIICQPAERFQIIKGKGAEGYIENELFWIGSYRFLHEKVGAAEGPAGIYEKIQELEAIGHSIVAIGHGQEICGIISIADAVRLESKNAIQAMKQAGIKRVVMLTGDNKGAAKTVAESTGIDEYYSELLPEDKVEQVQTLVKRYKHVAMVGDGINDAPAMAASKLGIAMGAAGSDAAIETADIALMSDDLGKLAWLVRHANHTLCIIKQNVVFSLAVKSAFVALTFANKSSLWLAVLSDMGATFVVVSNSLRLLSNRKKRQPSRPEIVAREPSPMLHQFPRTQLRQLPTTPDIELASVSGKQMKGCRGGCSGDCHGTPLALNEVVIVDVTAQQETKKVLGSSPSMI